MKSNVDTQYVKLSEREHVLHRPGMYIGSTKPHTETVYVLRDGIFKPENITYNPGFLKIFDEIISNSVDEHKRNHKLNQIKVTIDKETGWIKIWDNGGIPVKIHEKYNEWIPEMIFSKLRTGTNFNDADKRVVVGTNGVGCTLTNIFSKEFIIETCDKKKKFVQRFKNNLSSRNKPKITKITTKKTGYTSISYLPDFNRFGLDGIQDSDIDMIIKRLHDISACNPKLKLSYNGKSINYRSFSQYCKNYLNDTDCFFYENSKDWKIGVSVSQSGFQSVSFVNSVETKDDGTHVNYIVNDIIYRLREKIEKKYRIDIKPSEIKKHIFLFIDCTIHNPSFSSQTKEKLITEVKEFGTSHKVNDKTINDIFKSEIIESILDWIERKQAAEERAKLRKLNKKLSKKTILKLIDAKKTGKREDCTLAIFEGDSALSAFKRYRNPKSQGAYPLRGKFKNVREEADSKVIQNKEVQELMAAIGLKIGHEPKNLRYGKILIYTDADVDGNGIAALLLNFFGKYWPELFEEKRIIKVETPIIIAKKGNTVNNFYAEAEYKKWEDGIKDISKWDVEYKKGLAALEDSEYQDIIQNPRCFVLVKTKEFNKNLEAWFGRDSNPRKDKILGKTLIKNQPKNKLF